MMSRRAGLLWGVMLALLVLAAPVWAHGYIVRAIPEDRAVLDRAPLRVQVWFSESLEPEFSQITVSNAAGVEIASAPADPEQPSLLAVRLPPGLPDGAYSVDLRIAFASDGHVVYERRVFFVGEAGELAGASAADGALPLEVIWRALALGGAILLLGTTALYSLVLLPAWGSDVHAAGLPPRVMRALNGLMLAALLTALAGNLLALLQQTMAFFGADAGRVLSEGLWQVVRGGTRFGDTWTMRMVLLALVAGLWGASLWASRQQPALVRPFWAAGAWASALLLGAYSLASHAAGSPVLPWFALANDWLHLAAVGLWAGGLAALVVVLPAALRPYEGDARRKVLLAALNRFSPLAFVCVLVVTATGIFASLVWVSAPEQAVSSYGLTLAGKLVLVAGLVGMGALHRVALHPGRYARLEAWGARIGGLRRTLVLEAALALVVIGAAALLSATPVPRPAVASIPAPSAVAVIDGTRITVTLAPGGPGVNTADVLVEQAGAAVEGLPVAVRFADPARDWRSAWHAADEAGDGLYVAASAGIDRPGQWTVLVAVGEGEAALQAAVVFDIVPEAAVQTTREPGMLNLLALLGVAGAVIAALWPLLKRGYHRLNVGPMALLLLGGAALLAAVLIVGGVLLSQQSDALFEAQMNPPPAIINPALPDQASLERGAARLAQTCAGWEGSGEYGELVERLPGLRDEDLYNAVVNGWRSLPACSGLIDTPAWDVVNWLRAQEARPE